MADGLLARRVVFFGLFPVRVPVRVPVPIQRRSVSAVRRRGGAG